MNELCSFSNFSVTSPTSQLILPSLYLRHSSFSNPSIASSTSQFILQPFFIFFYVTYTSLNSPGEPPIHLLIIHCSILLQYSQNINDYFIFRHFFSVGIGNELLRVSYNFNYPTQSMKYGRLARWRKWRASVHSPIFPSLHLRHSSFFHRFTYVTVDSPTLLLLHLRHSSFSNPSLSSSTLQALHLRHLASRPWYEIHIINILWSEM